MSTEPRKRVRLGDLLLEKKLISEQQLKEALDEQRRSGRKLGRVLIDIGAVAEAELHGCLATALNMPFVDLAHLALDPKIVTKLPETHARRHRALVLPPANLPLARPIRHRRTRGCLRVMEQRTTYQTVPAARSTLGVSRARA